jgi:peptidyl-prolyl cis-trans isomerase C
MFSQQRSNLIAILLVTSLVLSSCSSLFGQPNTPTALIPTLTPEPPTATPPPLAATVNGEYVTLAELEAEVSRYQAAQLALGKTVSEADAEQVVLDDLIAQVLLAQEARKQGFELTEGEMQVRLDALAQQAGGAEALAEWQSEHGYSEDTFRIALKRTVEAAWMRDKIIAGVPETIEQAHIQQILTYNEADALQALEKLKAGTAFSELASTYDPVTRGDLGWVPRGYLLDLKIEEAAFSLQVGGVSDVISTPAGFHIIKVLAREDHLLSPDALLAVQEQALKDWVERQRQQNEIVIAP